MAKAPTFLIAGAMRCGTTSLNAYLREHPEISVSRPKEVHFFDNNFDLGLDWYLEHFPDSEESTAVGEATPDYLYEPEAAPRIAKTLADVKILLLLRDPAERAHSHYWHNRSVGREDLPFEEALWAEPMRLERGPEDRARYSYIDRGRYGTQIRHLFDHIPPERVLVQTFDEITANPTAVYRRTCRFLGVSDEYVPPIVGEVTNAYVEYRSSKIRDLSKSLPKRLRNAIAVINRKDSGPYEEMSDVAADLVRETTAPDNADLGELAGVSASWLPEPDAGDRR